WDDIDWPRNRFLVTSPKTEHLEGKGKRYVPIFPELRPYLEDAYELAAEGAVYVIQNYRDGDKNFRTRLERIILRGGLKPWPKLFHNLRASRETELAEHFPLHKACAWIGNDERIAIKHYVQLVDEDFEAAAERDSAKYIARNPKTSQNTSQHRTRTEH